MDLRKILEIDYYPELKDIPDTYLDYIKYSNTLNAQRLEFFGDRVLNLLVADDLMRHIPILTVRDLQDNYEEVTKNISLECMGRLYGVCDDKIKKKNCADKIEILLGVFYYWLEEKNIAPVPYIRKYLNELIGLDNIIDDMVQGYEFCSSLKANQPKYGTWSKWTSCQDGKRKRTRECINGKCARPLIEEAFCQSWTKCEDGLQFRYVDGKKEFRDCDDYSMCDEEGKRTLTTLTGVTQQVCPDYLYAESTHYDARCHPTIPGENPHVLVKKKCLYPNLCVDKIVDTLPCSETVPTYAEFVLLPEDQKKKVYNDVKHYMEDEFFMEKIPSYRRDSQYAKLLTRLSHVVI